MNIPQIRNAWNKIERIDISYHHMIATSLKNISVSILFAKTLMPRTERDKFIIHTSITIFIEWTECPKIVHSISDRWKNLHAQKSVALIHFRCTKNFCNLMKIHSRFASLCMRFLCSSKVGIFISPNLVMNISLQNL